MPQSIQKSVLFRTRSFFLNVLNIKFRKFGFREAIFTACLEFSPETVQVLALKLSLNFSTFSSFSKNFSRNSFKLSSLSEQFSPIFLKNSIRKGCGQIDMFSWYSGLFWRRLAILYSWDLALPARRKFWLFECELKFISEK